MTTSTYPVAVRAEDALLRALQADITTLAVDAIVNAANASLLGGGGVDGAIHRAAGPRAARRVPAARRLRDGRRQAHRGLPAARQVRGAHGGAGVAGRRCGRGRAARFLLPARLEVAAAAGARTIAYPSISTGVYGYPVEAAAKVAVAALREALRRAAAVEGVLLCCFSAADLAVYESLLSARG